MKTIISGVYVITNLVNGKKYIGSSADMPHRESVHFAYLQRGNHHNAHLQSSYNMYGKENFNFQILEYCNTSVLIEREQFYIDTLHPAYNKRLTADSNLGLKRSEESRKKMSDAKKGVVPWNKGGHHTEEANKKNSESHKGKIKSEETRQKLSEAGKKRYQSEEARRKTSEASKAVWSLRKLFEKISEI